MEQKQPWKTDKSQSIGVLATKLSTKEVQTLFEKAIRFPNK